MKYVLTTKGFTVTPEVESRIKKGMTKFDVRLKNISSDIPVLTIMMKRHEKHTFYSGQFSLKLMKKILIAKVTGHDEADLVGNGFTKLLFEFEKYKGTHFKGNSLYPHRETIRINTASSETLD